MDLFALVVYFWGTCTRVYISICGCFCGDRLEVEGVGWRGSRGTLGVASDIFSVLFPPIKAEMRWVGGHVGISHGFYV